MTMRTDEELMHAAGRGDPQAFEELVLRHQKEVWGFARRFLGDAVEAEDVAQETFLRILEAAPRYRATAPFHTYLYRVVTNFCLDRRRKKQPLYLDTVPETASTDASPEDDFAHQERNKAVRAALETIPARQKAAVILRHYQDLSVQEVSAIMDISPKAAERLLARARKTLQERLRDMLNE
jgi:RNA polymerase sigma-70 factor (ECF subfamily)